MTNRNLARASRVLALIEAAEATVLITDPMDSSRVIVGFRIPRSARPCASLTVAFDEMTGFATLAATERKIKEYIKGVAL